MKNIIALKHKGGWYVKNIQYFQVKTKSELLQYIKENGCSLDKLICEKERIFSSGK